MPRIENSTADREDTQYLSRCRNHDVAAWNRLYGDFAERVFKWVLFLGVHPHGAEEVTQEVFLTAYQKIHTCLSEAQLRSWLFQIARRHAANYRKSGWYRRFWKEKRGKSVSEKQDAVLPRSISSDVRQILLSLPFRQMEILLMHDLEGFTQSEISGMIGVPAGTVASRLRMARENFAAKWLEEES